MSRMVQSCSPPVQIAWHALCAHVASQQVKVSYQPVPLKFCTPSPSQAPDEEEEEELRKEKKAQKKKDKAAKGDKEGKKVK